MSLSGTYSIVGSNITLTSAATLTLAFLNPSAAPNLSFDILRCWVSQRGTTTSAQMGVQLSTQVTAFPTLTSATPVAHNRGAPASQITGGTAGAAGTAGINASAEGAGAKTILVPDNFNNLNGWVWVPTDSEQIVLPAGLASGFGLVLLTIPATLSGWSFGITYRES